MTVVADRHPPMEDLNNGLDEDAQHYEAALKRKVREQAVQMQQQGQELAWASDFARLCEEKVRQIEPTADLLTICHKVCAHSAAEPRLAAAGPSYRLRAASCASKRVPACQ